MNIKRNVIFTPEIRKKNGVTIVENVPIRMRVIYSGQRVEFSTGYRIDISKWDVSKQRVNKGCSNKLKQSASEINSELSDYESTIQDIFKEFEIQNIIPTPNQLKKQFSEKRSDSNILNLNKYSLFTVYDEFTKTVGKQNAWSKATFTKFNAVRTHLFNYNPDLSLDILSEEDLQGWLSYMHTVKVCNNDIRKEKNKDKAYEIGLRNTTIAHNISCFKIFLKWAFAKGYYKDNLYLSWKPRLKGTDGNQREVIHLTWDELLYLYNFPIPESKQYLARVRDVFCFCCFTSLRYSDVAKLSRSDIKDNYISIVTQKTVDSLKIELNNYSKAILEKYKDIPFRNDKALPVISNVKMNEYLKELGKIAEINTPQRIVYFKGNERIEEVYPKYELLTTQCGRRTFIVNALYLGIHAEVVMKWTGHSDYNAMKPYIKIVDDLKEREMNKFNQL